MEKSCGAVVYKFVNDSLYVLLVKHNSGHWSFSKGHMEVGEIEEETAIREIKEETNLDVILDNKFRFVNTYIPKKDVIKNVVYFIGIPTNDEVAIQKTEICDYCFCAVDKAYDIITYDGDKEVLRKACDYITYEKRLIKVKDNDNLLSVLVKEGIAKNKVKSLVKLGFVYVNDICIKKLPYEVHINDVILLDDYVRYDLKVIYEDSNYLVVDKPNGLLTISTSSINKYNENTLYKMVREYLNNKREYAFIVNRIDKETSGIVIFVKHEWLKNKLQDNWNNIVKDRKYIALVSGKIVNDGRIDNYLYEDKLTFSHSTNVGGKRAITNYKVLKNSIKYTLLDINIETGRKNQIRVHLSEMKHPVVGDKNYYSKDNSFKRLMLHHYELSLVNPINNKLIVFKSEIPNEFSSVFINN